MTSTRQINKVGIRGRRKYRTAALRRPHRERLRVGYRSYAEQLAASRQWTDRDWEIIRQLFCLGLLSRSQIQRIFWREGVSTAAVSARLRKLYRHWALNITTDTSYSMERVGLEPCHIYTLGPVGEEILAMDLGVERSKLGYTRRYASGRSSQNIMHDLLTAELYTQAVTTSYAHERQIIIEAKAQGLEGSDLQRTVNQERLSVSWYSEHSSAIWQGEREIVRPDGTLELIYHQERSLWFVEMDRGNTEWEKKVRAYDNGRQFGAWQSQLECNEFPAVLVVVPVRRAKYVARQLAMLKPTTRFLIKEMPDVLQTGALEGWHDSRNGQDEKVLVPL